MEQNLKKEAQLIIESLHSFKDQVEKGKQLSALIQEFQLHNFTLKEGEIWEIKGSNYKVVHSVFDVNFILVQQNKKQKDPSVFLSELLPLSLSDFKGVFPLRKQ